MSKKPDYVISSSKQFSFDYLAIDKYTITAVDLYNPKLSLEKNKLSFFSESFIEVKENDITNINFFFHKEETEVESDSLNVFDEIEEFASIIGNLYGNYILPVIIELKNEDNSFKSELSLDGTFKMKNVINGKYQLFAYQDRNNNSILDTGSLEKNINAEKFYVYPDSLTLRSNWELEIQDWNLDQ